MDENKTGKYLKYAVGEIILVVIGILIALAINNWNIEQQRKNELRESFKSILEEITFVRPSIENNIEKLDSNILNIQKSLNIFKSQNFDSVHKLKYTLKGFNMLYRLQFDLPVTMQFIEENNTKSLNNSSLIKVALKLKSEISFLYFLHDFYARQYSSIIRPYVVKNLNYAQLVTQSTIDVGRVVDYKALFDDVELHNIMNIKMESDIYVLKKLKELNTTLEALKHQILLELNNK